jgi:hypothetical protein
VADVEVMFHFFRLIAHHFSENETFIFNVLFSIFHYIRSRSPNRDALISQMNSDTSSVIIYCALVIYYWFKTYFRQTEFKFKIIIITHFYVADFVMQ